MDNPVTTTSTEVKNDELIEQTIVLKDKTQLETDIETPEAVVSATEETVGGGVNNESPDSQVTQSSQMSNNGNGLGDTYEDDNRTNKTCSSGDDNDNNGHFSETSWQNLGNSNENDKDPSPPKPDPLSSNEEEHDTIDDNKKKNNKKKNKNNNDGDDWGAWE